MKWLLALFLSLSSIAAFADHTHPPIVPGPGPDFGPGPSPIYQKVPATYSSIRVGQLTEPMFETTMWSGSVLVTYVRPYQTFRVEAIDNSGTWFRTTYNTGVELLSGWIRIRDVFILY